MSVAGQHHLRTSSEPTSLGGSFSDRAGAVRVYPRQQEYPFPEDPVVPSCCFPSESKKEFAETVFADRDPNKINQYVQVLWEDVIAEPDGVRTPYLSWRISAWLFRSTKDLIYTILSGLFGPPLAILLGCIFSLIAFLYIWCVSPLLRIFRLCMSVVRGTFVATTTATISPVMEAFGAALTDIRLRLIYVPENEQKSIQRFGIMHV